MRRDDEPRVLAAMRRDGESRVLAVSVTAAGARHTASLPYERHHGDLGDTVRRRWADVDAFVLFCAAGIAVRVIAPLLGSGTAAKRTDPAVVVVDEAARFVVPLIGGHGADANSLAVDVAELLEATPVLTTATDAAGVPALDLLPGLVAAGDVAGATRAILDGALPSVTSDLPGGVQAWAAAVAHWESESPVSESMVTLAVTDRVDAPADVTLHPASLVAGVGASSDAPAGEALALLHSALAGAGLAPDSVGLVATIERRAGDPVVAAFGRDVMAFTATELDPVEVPNPSVTVRAAVGTASVAEAAALLAAGPGAQLVIGKVKGPHSTVAVARRARPRGSLAVVGLGPGAARHRTPAATAAVRGAECVIGYTLYVEQVDGLLRPDQDVVPSPIGAEADRCGEALRRAAAGQRVALVCSGDAGVFAMATLVLELAPRYGNPPVEIVPGVTASLGAASILGAPLAHDHALISLSDLLTPWELIERRLRAAAEADMAVALYNPRSARRTIQLQTAKDILLESRPASTPAGIVANATRPGQRVAMTTLGELDPADVDMVSMVIVGSSATRIVNDRMVTPRGFRT